MKTNSNSSPELLNAFKTLGIATEENSPSEDVSLLKGQIDELHKSLASANEELEALKASSSTGSTDSIVKAEIDALNQKFESLGMIEKSIHDLVSDTKSTVEEFMSKAMEKIESISEEVEMIASNPVGRRSVAAGAGHIEKPFSLDEKSGKKVLSKSMHSKAIVEVLDGLAEVGESKEMYADATMRFETSRNLTKSVVDDLYRNHDIQIVD